MLKPIASHIRIVSAKIKEKYEDDRIYKEIKDEYNVTVLPGNKIENVKKLYEALKKLPTQLVKDCKIVTMDFKDLGPSKEFYPNHGRYQKGILTLNERILKDTSMEEDKETHKKVSKFEHTYFHELGHGFDEKKHEKDKWLSLKDDWLKLSGWSESPKPGYKRLIIREEGAPELKGEWYYSPDAKFSRFYGKRNPWDDFADSFSYYVAGLKSYLPPNKRKYFDDLLKEYYMSDQKPDLKSLYAAIVGVDFHSKLSEKLYNLSYKLPQDKYADYSKRIRTVAAELNNPEYKDPGRVTTKNNKTLAEYLMEHPKGIGIFLKKIEELAKPEEKDTYKDNIIKQIYALFVKNMKHHETDTHSDMIEVNKEADILIDEITKASKITQNLINKVDQYKRRY